MDHLIIMDVTRFEGVSVGVGGYFQTSFSIFPLRAPPPPLENRNLVIKNEQ